MDIKKEVTIAGLKFTVSKEYMAIEGKCELKDRPFSAHLSRAEAAQVVGWLNNELNRVLPEIIQMSPASEARVFDFKPVYAQEVANTPPKRTQMPQDECSYDPGPRSATQTVKLNLGDPNLAYNATSGRTNIKGDGDTAITDLGALAEKEGRS